MTHIPADQLTLEAKEETPSGDLGGGIMITPQLSEEYWLYRVRLADSPPKRRSASK